MIGDEICCVCSLPSSCDFCKSSVANAANALAVDADLLGSSDDSNRFYVQWSIQMNEEIELIKHSKNVDIFEFKNFSHDTHLSSSSLSFKRGKEITTIFYWQPFQNRWPFKRVCVIAMALTMWRINWCHFNALNAACFSNNHFESIIDRVNLVALRIACECSSFVYVWICDWFVCCLVHATMRVCCWLVETYFFYLFQLSMMVHRHATGMLVSDLFFVWCKFIWLVKWQWQRVPSADGFHYCCVVCLMEHLIVTVFILLVD